jgi:hypothetical protein
LQDRAEALEKDRAKVLQVQRKLPLSEEECRFEPEMPQKSIATEQSP